jgi:P27 family predicted phage terminase small subunit
MPQPAKTPAEHELHGTVPQNRYKQLESYLPPGRPKFPKTLSKAGRQVFKMLCQLLQERRVLTHGDLEAIRLYSLLHQRHARATEHLEVEEEICEYTRLDSNGQAHKFMKANLWLKVATDAEGRMLAILVQLGLTPKAKDFVKPTKSDKPKEESLMDRFLSGKKLQVSVVQTPVKVDAVEMDAGGVPDEEPETIN